MLSAISQSSDPLSSLTVPRTPPELTLEAALQTESAPFSIVNLAEDQELAHFSFPDGIDRRDLLKLSIPHGHDVAVEGIKPSKFGFGSMLHSIWELYRGMQTISQKDPYVTVLGHVQSADLAALERDHNGHISKNFDIILDNQNGLRVIKSAENPEFTSPAEYKIEEGIETKFPFVRRVLSLKYSKGLIALPGDFSMLNNVFEALTLIQTGKIPALPIVLVDRGFWAPLIDWIEKSLASDCYATISKEDLKLFKIVDSVDDALKYIAAEENVIKKERKPGVDYKMLFRVAKEFVTSKLALKQDRPAISVFGSARLRSGHPDYESAKEMGVEARFAGYSVLTGAGPGIMEAAPRGAKDEGGTTLGCAIKLPHEQKTNDFMDVAVDFHYFFIRKLMLIDNAAAVVAHAGGFGTLDEIFESAATRQRGQNSPDCPVVLVGRKFWEPLLKWLHETASKGYGSISEEQLAAFYLADSAAEAAEYIKAQQSSRGVSLRYIPSYIGSTSGSDRVAA